MSGPSDSVEEKEKLLALEERRTKTIQQDNKKELEQLNQQIEYSQLNLTCKAKLLDIFVQTEAYKNFRFECHKLVRKFEEFQNIFEKDLENTKQFIQKMNSSKELVKLDEPEKLKEARQVLQDFCDMVQRLTVVSDDQVQFLKVEQIRIMEIYDEINSMITETVLTVDECRDSFKGVLTKVSIRKSREYTACLNKILESYEEIKRESDGLEEVVKKFEIPPSEKFERAWEETYEKLSTEILKIQSEPAVPLAIEPYSQEHEKSKPRSLMNDFMNFIFDENDEIGGDLLYKINYFLNINDEDSNASLEVFTIRTFELRIYIFRAHHQLLNSPIRMVFMIDSCLYSDKSSGPT
ncbi:unnamed protein product [Caenorhabditis brenneri]